MTGEEPLSQEELMARLGRVGESIAEIVRAGRELLERRRQARDALPPGDVPAALQLYLESSGAIQDAEVKLQYHNAVLTMALAGVHYGLALHADADSSVDELLTSFDLVEQVDRILDEGTAYSRDESTGIVRLPDTMQDYLRGDARFIALRFYLLDELASIYYQEGWLSLDRAWQKHRAAALAAAVDRSMYGEAEQLYDVALHFFEGARGYADRFLTFATPDVVQIMERHRRHPEEDISALLETQDIFRHAMSAYADFVKERLTELQQRQPPTEPPLLG
jgi:hypothetical protein